MTSPGDLIPTGEPFTEIPYAVAYDPFMASIWTTAAVALLFVIVRIYARIRSSGQLFPDDIFVLLACVIVFITGSLWQWVARDMYILLEILAGNTQLLEQLLASGKLVAVINVHASNHVLHYACLTAIKLSVLLFFRRLGGYRVDTVRRIWWFLVGYVLIGLIITVACTPWKCFIKSPDKIIEFTMECNAPDYQEFVNNVYKVNTALDVSSDFFIMTVPVLLVWDLHIPLKKKLAFVGLFSMTIIVMVIAVVRLVGAFSDGHIDPTFAFLWGSIEMCIATMISCLSSFPQLFISSKSNKPAYKPSETFIERVKNRAMGRKKAPSTHMVTDEFTGITLHDGNNYEYVTMPESTKSRTSIRQPHTEEIPLDGMRPQSPNGGIMMTQEYQVQSFQRGV
ncbi:hypothetical protein QBC38DRAFT_501902 [Podospora fimiseda]|uniref:Rhodopsin domain-containing protein n=1 Tax=Podospora fimiseda TaxID=252190 RepID=A0AAN7GY14_9PEZI|nr:hypothetical protein QBC38DRAFT_501902 [Podospora fimiseda]